MDKKLCDCAAWNASECLCGSFDSTVSGRITLQDWYRTRQFLRDLTDPEKYGFAVSGEVRRRALELQEIYK